MTNDNKALPWFPITSEYIDYYYDSVIKYIREVRFLNGASVTDDSSYATTVALLFKWAEDKFHTYSEAPVYENSGAHPDSLEKDLRLIALAALLTCLDGRPESSRYLFMTAYILSLLRPDLSGTAAEICLRVIRSERILSTGFTIDNIDFFEAHSFAEAMAGAEVAITSEERWYENHGSVRVIRAGVSLFGMLREYAELKMKTNGTKEAFKPVACIENQTVTLLQDRKEKKAFNLASFAGEVKDLTPGETVFRKADYDEGDDLTVKVVRKTYDTVEAESIDPAYNLTSGPVVIGGSAKNVRGIYMPDIARNVSVGTFLNVTWDGECFMIDDTLLDFLYKKYWQDDADELRYARMKAILLFPHERNTPNTWLTEYGFMVRTQYEEYPRYAYRILEVNEYNKDYDFFMASVSEEEPDDLPFSPQSARDALVQRFIAESGVIDSGKAPMPAIRQLEHYTIAILHRILAQKLRYAVDGVDAREDYLNICSALALIAGDEAEYSYYRFLGDYLHSLVAFARGSYADIASLDEQQALRMGMPAEKMMLDVLREYGSTEESEVLAEAISHAAAPAVSDVAKLVQAANRFIGSPSISELREVLHKEICLTLSVADAIQIGEDAADGDRFPLPPESDSVEHKMSWVYDNETSLPNETAQSSKILKTVCAFMNRLPEQGVAHLYIGADEKRRVINGIQTDIDFLLSKGELAAEGDPADAFSRHVLDSIRKRFPEDHALVSPYFCCDGRVLDLRVSPARSGVVFFHDTAYYRYGSSTRVMPDAIRDEISIRKASYRDDFFRKVEAVRRAIRTRSQIVLHGYDSSHGDTTGVDRVLEAYAFVDNGRFDAIWAFDAEKDRKNKVFLLKRADSVEVLDKRWLNERLHQTHPLDMFGFFGSERIPFSMEIKSTLARNVLIEQYPGTESYLSKTPDGTWFLSGTLCNRLSLSAACAFFLGYAESVDIGTCPEFKAFVTARLAALVDRI